MHFSLNRKPKNNKFNANLLVKQQISLNLVCKRELERGYFQTDNPSLQLAQMSMFLRLVVMSLRNFL